MSTNLPKRGFVSQASQAMNERANVPRSKFVNSWTRKTTFDQGLLIPFYVDEVLPGDHFRISVTALLRIATLLFPQFDNFRVDTHFFYTPNRLLWSNFEKFMGEQTAPGDSIAFTIPQMVSAAGGFPINSLADHFGIPCVGQIGGADILSVNALPFRAYNQIYSEWFRDQNLIATAFDLRSDAAMAIGNCPVQRRAKTHDYFTSCLPWAQKFTVAGIPLSGQAPVSGIGVADPTNFPGGGNWRETSGALVAYGSSEVTSAANRIAVRGSSANGSPMVFAELSQATATIAINAFRNAFMLQTLVERDARGGTRYTEIVKSHFGVTSPDARQQRPEYIGGGSSPLVVTPVAQTATGGGGLGSLAAAATAAGSHSATYAATEHGYIIGLISVKSELSYQQGLHKMWSRSTRYDFYWPALAGLGEQAVLRKEIYCTGNVANDDVVFGYNERWQEYRTRPSEVTCMFRSTSAGTIDPWHAAQRFTVAPVLGQTFIEDTAPVSRIVAAGVAANNMQFLADIAIHREVVRPVPMFGTPAILGRF